MLTRESAETLALKALGWLVAEADLLPVFLGSTGLGEADLRERAGDADLLGAILDFLLMDDAWVTRFCDSHDVGYDHLMQARAALPGGEQVHWT